MAQRFENKVVVVTGGSEGIGLTTAKSFAAEGAQVYITGRNEDRLDTAIGEIGNGVTGVQGDVSNSADLDRLYAQIRRDQGRVDVVFANAGISEQAALGDIDEAHFDRLFDINVKGMVFTVQKALPLMSTGGAVVLTGSGAGVKGFPGLSIYSATKAAIRALARSWTADLQEPRDPSQCGVPRDGAYAGDGDLFSQQRRRRGLDAAGHSIRAARPDRGSRQSGAVPCVGGQQLRGG